MNAEPTIYNEVKAAIDDWSASYISRDMRRLLACIAPDADVVMYGTGADEKRIGLNGIQSQAERDWSQTDAAGFYFQEPTIGAAGSVAWAAADCTFQVEIGGQTMAFPGRFTGVFEKRGGRWLVVQAHFSLPAAQDDGESVPNNG
ncbi:MAG: nuclear transport factor 2 family protein [Anaerolineae bacterium]|nr:nuclear transport factor 2 family protein [Anaerolineae bacterium]